ncbi:hypothetical protein AXF42_Ash013088 [Apostasia shenzhenica]|uniref:PHD-type domain-containing protein n=1 Tax=Apostasia shenzhenica TaxID=1088818 RepID=A0A2I0BD00_9ASPA|nr:hypothetical protein AXF42_Ash013088 [Apostasia shenzhenica]
MTTAARRVGEAVGGGGESLLLLPSGGCSGDGCDAVEPWPVHQVRHRNNVFLRLCTSCVLKNHPGSFCCSCFEVLDHAERPPLVHCSKCPSVAHLSCLPDPTLAPLFLCPACDSPSPTSFSYFPYSKKSADRIIGLRASKILLAAARLSATSMTRAAALARADAEKKVKEAALAKKRARDMLDMALSISEKENEKMKESVKTTAVASVATSAAAAEEMMLEPKKKPARLNSAVTPSVAAQKRVQNREREKWMRFSEPVASVNRPTPGIEKEIFKGKLNSVVKGNEVKDKKEKGMHSGSCREGERGVADTEKGPARLTESSPVDCYGPMCDLCWRACKSGHSCADKWVPRLSGCVSRFC